MAHTFERKRESDSCKLDALKSQSAAPVNSLLTEYGISMHIAECTLTGLNMICVVYSSFFCFTRQVSMGIEAYQLQVQTVIFKLLMALCKHQLTSPLGLFALSISLPTMQNAVCPFRVKCYPKVRQNRVVSRSYGEASPGFHWKEPPLFKHGSQSPPPPLYIYLSKIRMAIFAAQYDGAAWVLIWDPPRVCPVIQPGTPIVFYDDEPALEDDEGTRDKSPNTPQPYSTFERVNFQLLPAIGSILSCFLYGNRITEIDLIRFSHPIV